MQRGFLFSELIIFQNIKTPISNSNYWKPEIVVPMLLDASALSNTENNQITSNTLRQLSVSKDFTELSADTYQLSKYQKALAQSRHYKVLKHLRWRQPGLSKKEAISIRVNAGEVFPLYINRQPDQSLAEIKQITENYRQALDAIDELRLNDYQRIDGYPLDGTVKIYLGRYLHIETDLILTLPVEAKKSLPLPRQQFIQESAESIFEKPLGKQSYRFKTHRRMRSKELHHLDHPKFGLLINITEFKTADSSRE